MIKQSISNLFKGDKHSLIGKLSRKLILILVIIFSIIIVSTYFITSKSITNSITREVSILAEKNAKEIEAIFSKADMLSRDLSKNVEMNITTNPAAVKTSIENEINDIVLNQEEFFALGVTFEPYVFDKTK